MQAIQALTFNEKLGAGLLILFGPVYIAAATFFGPDSSLAREDFGALFLWHICWAIIIFVTFCTAIATIFFKPDFHSSRLRMLAGRILPITAMVLAMLLSSVVMNTISNREKRAFAYQNEHTLAGTPPQAVVYREGVPDGGIAIVRSPERNPEYFAQDVMLDLTGEHIRSCQRLSEIDWSCHFD